MSTNKPIHKLELVMQSMITQTRDYFVTEQKICITDVDLVDSPDLLDMTAIVGFGGMVNLWAVFSFQNSLVNAVYEWMTVGFEDRPEDVQRHHQAAIGELVNIILGHCTRDFEHLDSQAIPMTPPVILESDSVVSEMSRTVFLRHCLNSRYGRLNISLVGPKESHLGAFN